MAALNQLPIEVQAMIFGYILTSPFQPNNHVSDQVIGESVVIVGGRPMIVPPTALFYVCHSFTRLAYTVVFSRNEFTLQGDPAKTLSWLRRQSYTKLIKRLVLKVPLWQLAHTDMGQSWNDLVAALPVYFNIPGLVLSLDGCRDHHAYDADTDMNYSWMRSAYGNLVQPFVSGRFKNLKNFSVRWPEWTKEEAEIKEAIKKS